MEIIYSRFFDQDGDGFISAKELQEVLTNLGEHAEDDEIQEMINQVDRDGDGMISYQEFVQMMSL